MVIYPLYLEKTRVVNDDYADVCVTYSVLIGVFATAGLRQAYLQHLRELYDQIPLWDKDLSNYKPGSAIELTDTTDFFSLLTKELKLKHS